MYLEENSFLYKIFIKEMCKGACVSNKLYEEIVVVKLSQCCLKSRLSLGKSVYLGLYIDHDKRTFPKGCPFVVVLSLIMMCYSRTTSQSTNEPSEVSITPTRTIQTDLI